MSIRGHVSRNFLNLVAAVTKLGICIWALLVVGVLWTCLPAVAEELSVELQVMPRMQKGRISPYIFGAGIDAKTNPLRAPKYPEKVLRDIEESGLRIARYPGGFVFNRNDHRGSWANFYWQDHIGQNPERLPYEVYDLDTFLQLCERFDIEPLLQINFVGETQESVQGYLEYLVGDGDVDGDGVNWAEKRKANGRMQPYKITYWQLGNEVHSYPQGFQENAEGAKEYGYRMPIYWVFKLLSEQRGEFLVESRLQGNNSIDAPKPGLYFDPEFAFDRVTHCASISGNRLYVALLNKDANQAVESRIEIRDWPRKAAVEVHEVRADSYLAENTIERPDTVKLADPQILQLAQTGTVTYQLKPNSLVVLRFEGARDE